MLAAGKSASAAILGFLLALPDAPAKADFIPPCAPPQGVVAVPLEQTPSVLLQALKDHVGEIVAPGEKFDSTDVVTTGRNRRFIFIWRAGRKWIIATEHGGRGYNDPIFVYQLDEDSRSAVLLVKNIAFPHSVCAVAHELVR